MPDQINAMSQWPKEWLEKPEVKHPALALADEINESAQATNPILLHKAAAKLRTIPDLEAENAKWRKQADTLTHQVICCGVAASHPDPALTTRGAYAGKWNSAQAEQVRQLRADRDKLQAELTALRAQSQGARVPDGDMWLLSNGNDGLGSTLVVGWPNLRKAWLDAHYFGVDHNNLDDRQRDTLSILEDSEEWQCDDSGKRFSLHISYEGDWVAVIRVDDASALSSAPTAPQSGAPSAENLLKILPKPSTLITTEDVGHRGYTTADMADAYRMGLAATHTTSEGGGS
jgi:hypothetical protein